MKKKLFGLIGLSIVAAPLITLVACSEQSNDVKQLGLHEYFVDKNIQDSTSRKHVLIKNISRNQIKNASNDVLSREHSTQISGGFGEIRHYYRDNGVDDASMHLGIDTFLRPDQELFSPVEGDVIASYWVRNNNASFATGIGGVVIIKSKIADLNIDPKLKEFIYVNFGTETNPKISKVPLMQYVYDGQLHMPDSGKIKTEDEYNQYWNNLLNKDGVDKIKINHDKEKDDYIALTFMHLSKNSPDVFGQTLSTTNTSYEMKYAPLDYLHPHKIHRGESIGFIGSPLDNGGWPPHVHVEAYAYGYSSRFQTNEELYKVVDTPLENGGPWRKLKPTGTYVLNSPTLLNKAQNTPWEITMNSSTFRMIDPNNIYNLYNNDDVTIDY